MSHALARAAVIVAVLAAPRAARADDDWLGPDKALHFGASAAIASGGYAIGSIWIEPIWKRATLGAGLALTAGAAKEAWDATGRGDASWKDATWDVLGTAVGVALSILIDQLVHR
jgi:putative lipoprotein